MKSLVLSGGGWLGFAHVGACQFLQDHAHLDDVHEFVGTSIGALVCMFLSFSFPVSKLKDIMKELDIASVMLDMALNSNKMQIVQEKLENFFVSNKVHRLTTITFADVQRCFGNRLRIVTCNVKTKALEILDDVTAPNHCVLDVVLAAMSHPLFFPPKRIQGGKDINNTTGVVEELFLMDAAPLCNLPIPFVSPDILEEEDYLAISLETVSATTTSVDDDSLFVNWHQNSWKPEVLCRWLSYAANDLVMNQRCFVNKEKVLPIKISSSVANMEDPILTPSQAESLFRIGYMTADDFFRKETYDSMMQTTNTSTPLVDLLETYRNNHVHSTFLAHLKEQHGSLRWLLQQPDYKTEMPFWTFIPEVHVDIITKLPQYKLQEDAESTTENHPESINILQITRQGVIPMANEFLTKRGTRVTPGILIYKKQFCLEHDFSICLEPLVGEFVFDVKLKTDIPSVITCPTLIHCRERHHRSHRHHTLKLSISHIAATDILTKQRNSDQHNPLYDFRPDDYKLMQREHQYQHVINVAISDEKQNVSVTVDVMGLIFVEERVWDGEKQYVTIK